MSGPYAGMTAEQRAAKRGEIVDRNVARAMETASRVCRSIVCGEYGRHNECAGAANCLCDCHDQDVP